MRNAQFPTPVSDDGAGNIVWNDPDITAFAAIYAATLANGWQLPDGMLGSANFAMLSTTTPGPYYLTPDALDIVGT
jgi:hypothetical protein